MRPVRAGDEALADVARQLDLEAAQRFVRLDLRPAIDYLAQVEDWLVVTVPHGPGRRLTIDGSTVAGYHLWVALDPLDPRVDALVVYRVDIWAEAWPDEAEP